jgi:hypothetical protein
MAVSAMHSLHCRYSHLGRTNFHGYICWIKKKLRYNFSKLPNKIILMELLLPCFLIIHTMGRKGISTPFRVDKWFMHQMAVTSCIKMAIQHSCDTNHL